MDSTNEKTPREVFRAFSQLLETAPDLQCRGQNDFIGTVEGRQLAFYAELASDTNGLMVKFRLSVDGEVQYGYNANRLTPEDNRYIIGILQLLHHQTVQISARRRVAANDWFKRKVYDGNAPLNLAHGEPD